MRFTLYGEAEGVLGNVSHPCWATYHQDAVTDASISARSKGIHNGMAIHAAKALVPGIVLEEEPELATEVLQEIWNELWSTSPWLETVGKRNFYLQIPGENPPLREIRNLLLSIQAKLSEEQRIRVGVAENPFLARALLEWSKRERVQGARYYKVGRQQFIVSPTLSMWVRDRAPREVGRWIREMPISTLWVLPENVLHLLNQFGVSRLSELEKIPDDKLVRHFGKESILWSRLLHQEIGGVIRSNYPPLSTHKTWHAMLSEDVELSLPNIQLILESLACELAADFQKNGIGALKVGVRWETDVTVGSFERAAKKPVYTPEAFEAAVLPGLNDCCGSYLQRFELYAEDLRPLQSVQASFVLKDGVFMSVEELQKRDLGRVVSQVNRKFPKGLQVGLRPTFRELRLQAILDQTSGGGT